MRGRRNLEEFKEFCVGKTIKEISEHFGITEGTARVRCSTYGIKCKSGSDIYREQFMAYAPTHTAEEIANHFNKTKSNVRAYANSHNIQYKKIPSPKGLERKVSKHTGTAQDMIITLCDFYSYESIGRVFGYTKQRIEQIYHKHLEEANEG